jgi:lipoate-protein ligase A
MRPIRLLNLGPTHWLNTQAVYHALAEMMTEDTPDTIVLAQPLQPYLCIGYHQALESVLDRKACARLSLPIVRRRVGGGATYLDVNQLFYQCIFHHRRLPGTVDRIYARLLAGPVATLHALGLNAELRDQNEIEINSRRIAGIGGGRIGEAVVVVGNFLFDFNYNALARTWRVPSESFRRLAVEALREQITTLWTELPRPVSPDEVQHRLTDEFARALNRPLEPGKLSQAEAERIKQVARRLVSHKWLHLHANGAHPVTSLKISRGVFIRYAEELIDGCLVRAAFRLRDGVIEQAVLESEPERDWSAARARLRGARIEAWRQLASPPL